VSKRQKRETFKLS